MIVDGKQIALEIQTELKEVVRQLDMPVFLHIFVMGENPVIESFVKYKKAFAEDIGVEFVEHRFNEDTTQQELIKQIAQVTKVDQGSPGPLGIVVQLPLSAHIETQSVLDAVPAELDVDGLSTVTSYLTPVAGAVKEILERERVSVEGKRSIVVGKGKLVGKPVAEMLADMGANVNMVDKSTEHSELTQLCQNADIVVSGAGVPNLITKEMVKQGCVLLDAGTSTQSGNLVGDIALECVEKASVFAKTPGGIGPMTVAILFKNLVVGNVSN